MHDLGPTGEAIPHIHESCIKLSCVQQRMHAYTLGGLAKRYKTKFGLHLLTGANQLKVLFWST